MKQIFNSRLHFNDSYAWVTLIILLLMTMSCEDFVDVDPPNNQITGELVFEDSATVNAALSDIYSKLRDNALTNGGSFGLTNLLGHYADELTLFSNAQLEVQFFYENSVLPTSSIISDLWNTSFNLIYAANNIIEGVQNSETLTTEDKDQFLGEAYFIRAFIHFHLMNLYGEIPYIKTTDYQINSQVSKRDETELYTHLIDDLLASKSLLLSENTVQNTRPNKWVSSAFLSRVYLYQQNWEMALSEALEIISNGNYVLNSDISQAFLKNSTETLWQFDAARAGNNTLEALTYIFVTAPPPNTALSDALVESFEIGDSRFTEWLGSASDGTNTWYYTFKYKLNSITGSTQECSIIIRLAELYLIAAEANAQLGNVSEGLNFLNAIRTRADLTPLALSDNSSLLQAIMAERQIEFFVEQGHRWFDLKRTNRANEELSAVKPNWNATDVLLPLPQSELILNPNLMPQNEGY